MKKTCKKLPAGTPKRILADAHKVKMGAKELVREHYAKQFSAGHIYANQSKRHENYGETPAQQEARMAQK